MGTNKKESAKDMVLVGITVPKSEFEALAGQNPEFKMGEFTMRIEQTVNWMAHGGCLLSPDEVHQMKSLMGVGEIRAASLMEVLARGMRKTPAGRTVLQVEVDPAYVETLKNWARAGGHEDDWEEYVQRAFAYIMHQGWLCGVPTDVIAVEMTPPQFEMLRSLLPARPDGGRLTGADVIDVVSAALDATAPAAFLGEGAQA